MEQEGKCIERTKMMPNRLHCSRDRLVVALLVGLMYDTRAIGGKPVVDGPSEAQHPHHLEGKDQFLANNVSDLRLRQRCGICSNTPSGS